MYFLKALLNKNLALFWSGQVMSSIGDFFYQIAVVWMAIQVGGSQGGIVMAVQSASALCCGLLGGVYADRWNRRITMIVVDITRAIAVATLPLLAAFGSLQLWYMALVAVIVGGLGSLFDPALRASLPALAGDEQMLQAANGLMDVTRRLARALGPGLAALLIAFIPLTHFFTLDAISFIISAFSILLLSRHFVWKTAQKQQRSPGIAGVARELHESLLLVRKHEVIGWTIFMLGIVNMAWSAAFIVGVPLLAKDVLHQGVQAVGLITGAYGVGNVVSNLIIGSLHIKRRVLMMFTAQIVVGTGFLIMVSAPVLPVAILGSALAALGGPMGDIMFDVLVQTSIPASHLGKVFSLQMTVSSVGSSLGLLFAGPFFLWLGIVPGIILCALLIAATSIVRLLFALSARSSRLFIDVN